MGRSQTPAPGLYSPEKLLLKPSSPKFTIGSSKRVSDLTIKPGPGDYEI